MLDLPITMNSLRPIIPVKINGQDTNFLLDSGAFYSMISTATAAQYHLNLEPAPYGLRVMGVGGATDVHVATVKEFSIAGVTVKKVQFLVGGSEVGSAGILGQNLLSNFDVEYDFANGLIRLFRTENCQHTILAYWLKPGDAYSMMDIDRIEAINKHTNGIGYVNGQKITITFDTGAYMSILSLKAAARAGITPESPGVTSAGYSSGLGRGMVRQYIGTFASFRVGDQEEIRNAKLRFADLGLEQTDMLLGADFFVSHHIIVANREHKLFLSYNGGPVFDLRAAARPAAPAAAASTTTPASPAPGDAGPDTPASAADAPALQAADSGGKVGVATDVGEIARRGAALAARRDFAAAIVELSKAVDLSPSDPEYYYQRANAYWANNQPDLALADFDRVISLKKDFLPAYIPRAELKFRMKDPAAALVDLDTVDRLAPPQADLRFPLAELYERSDHLPAAIEQYDVWIPNHPDDSRMTMALSARCYYSALQNQDLNTALSDCSTALRSADKKNASYPHLFVNRGLVQVRLGKYDKALSDFDDALKIAPKNARALYARALAESHLNKKPQSEADIRAATEISPKIAEHYEKYGFMP